MNLKFCFLTPEQEETMKAEILTYTADDRNSLFLLVAAINDLIHILENYALDSQTELTQEQFQSLFQTLGKLIEPVYEYFSTTSGLSLETKNATVDK